MKPRILPILLAFGLLLAACKDRDRPPAGLSPAEDACEFLFRTKTVRAWEGEPLTLTLRLTNVGRRSWSSSDPHPVFLSYHLLDAKRRIIRFENERFPLPAKVRPGETIPMVLRTTAPLEQGRYHLELDLVREGVSWFRDHGSKTRIAALRVKARPWPEAKKEPSLKYGRYTAFRTDRGEFSSLFKLIRITLHHNETAFDGRTGRVVGFRAGSGYPQIWLRDAATIPPAGRWFYEAPYFTSWLEEHLALQQSDGSLWDWFDSRGTTDKNTVETDQEAGAVLAAAEAVRLVGPSWLKKSVAGRSVLERLERSLRFVLDHRFDERLGLVLGTHTIDWGDVEDVEPDEEAVRAGPSSRWTADLYDQAMFYRAALDLSDLMEAAGFKEKSMFWSLQAQALKKRTNALLWQADRGFYRVHLHLDPNFVHDFDEDGMFAMGGNITAVLAGLADETQKHMILSKALELQKTFGLPTVSGVLLPPYPAGVFVHPAVDEEFEYQNGGLWDWFGGKLVYALFENGHSRTAKKKLREIVLKCVRNGVLSEWDDRQGTSRGSGYFSGSAGSLGLALFQGYFGLKMDASAVSLEPKLGGDSAKVHAYLPAADLFLAYEQRVLADGKTLILDFNSNFPGRGTVKVLLPWVYIADESREVEADELEVTLDGAPVSFRKSRLLQDEFVVVETDFKNRRLKIRHR